MKNYLWIGIVVAIAIASIFLISFDENEQERLDGAPSGSSSPQTITQPETTETEEPVPEEPITPKSDRPILKGLGVSFDKWDESSKSAGDFIFDKGVLFEDDYIKNEKVLLEFGVREHLKENPNQNVEYWYFLKPKTKVKAITEGTVRISFIEHTKDWSVNVETGSGWTVSFEHLLNLEVKDGDTVKPGDVLGEAVPWSANKNIGFTELSVWKGGAGVSKYCPFDFLDESMKPEYEQKIKQLASDWEEFIGRDVYKQEIWTSPGCVVDKVQET